MNAQCSTLCVQDDGAYLTVGQSNFESDAITIEGFAGRANLAEKDIVACDSVIHIVDRILISEEISNKMSAMDKGRNGITQRREGEALDEPPEATRSQIADDSNLPEEVLEALVSAESTGSAEQKDGSTVNTAPGCDTIWRAIELRPELSSLKEALGNANLFDVVTNADLTATFFAPDNGAFKVFWEGGFGSMIFVVYGLYVGLVPYWSASGSYRCSSDCHYKHFYSSLWSNVTVTDANAWSEHKLCWVSGSIKLWLAVHISYTANFLEV